MERPTPDEHRKAIKEHKKKLKELHEFQCKVDEKGGVVPFLLELSKEVAEINKKITELRKK